MDNNRNKPANPVPGMYHGFSKREKMALELMAAGLIRDSGGYNVPETEAQMAVRRADALLAELERSSG